MPDRSPITTVAQTVPPAPGRQLGLRVRRPRQDCGSGQEAQGVAEHDPQKDQGLVPPCQGRLLAYVLEQEELQEENRAKGRQGSTSPGRLCGLLPPARMSVRTRRARTAYAYASQEDRQQGRRSARLPRRFQRGECALNGGVHRDAQQDTHGEGLPSRRSPGREARSSRRERTIGTPARRRWSKPGRPRARAPIARPAGPRRGRPAAISQRASHPKKPHQRQGQERRKKQCKGVDARNDGTGPDGLSQVEDEVGEQDPEKLQAEHDGQGHQSGLS